MLSVTVQDNFIDSLTRDIQRKEPHVRLAVYRLAEFAFAYNIAIDFPIVGEIRRELDSRLEVRPLDSSNVMQDIVDESRKLLAEKETIRQCVELFCGISIP